MSENKMNKIFDERKISTFRDFKDLVRSNKLIGRREICIVVNRLELENVIYKAEMYDEAKKDYKKRKIEKEKEIDRLNNIINELESYLEQQWLEWKDDCDDGIVAMANEDKTVLDKLKELKEK